MISFYERVKTEPVIFRKFYCNDLLFTEYTCPLGVGKHELWTECSYFVYILKGEKKWFAHEKSWILKAGESAFIKKGAYRLEITDEEEICLLVFFIPDSYVGRFLDEKSFAMPIQPIPENNCDFFIPIRMNVSLESFYQSVLCYFTQKKPPQTPLLELKFQELLYNILYDPENAALAAYLYQTRNKPPTLPEIMEANYLHNLQLKDIACLCNRSLSSFKRDFQSVYGCPPKKWLTEKRIRFACQMLKNTAKPISEISFESGFENTTHFCKLFKHGMGKSPLSYRRQPNSPNP